MTLFLASLALAVLAAGYVVLPMVRRRLALLGDPIPGGVLDAEARKRVALASLKEVEYDRLGGKLDGEDYHRLRSQLEHEALLAIQAAEDVHAATDGAPGFQVTHSCGFVNPPASRFCSGCGRRLG